MDFVKNLMKDKSRLRLAGGIITFLAIVSVIAFMFLIRTRVIDFINDGEMDKTESAALAFTAVFQEQLYLIDGMSELFAIEKHGTEEEIRQALSEIEEPHFFEDIGFADKEGKAIFIGEEEAVDVKSLYVFKKAIAGESNIADEFVRLFGENKVIVLASPVVRGGNIEGVMLGTMPERTISELVDSISRENDRLLVVDNALNIIGKSSHEDKVRVRNKYDYYTRQYKYADDESSQSVKAMIKEKGEGIFRITISEEELFMVLTPLSINNWYAVRYDSVKESNTIRSYIMWLVVAFSVIIIVLFSFMYYILYSTIMNMIELESMNAKYSILDNENKIVTFSYNPDSRAVELNGAVEQALGKEIADMGTVNLVSLLDKLHESDQGLSKNIMKAVREGQNKYETEIRVMNAEGGYDWYKLDAIITRNRSGKVERIIGNLKNSEDQIAKEHVLRNKAERDLLTGLLNKITMQQSVDEAIRQRPYSTFAFYIIDMDNFKAVNDNLGHATGDKVLVDVANKLTLLFNEYDYIGRLGGDEFAVMLVIPENMSNYSSRLIDLKAKGVCDNMKETYSDEDVCVTVSASVGIALYGKDGSSFEELYKHADLALYHSKNTGKDKYTFYSEELEKHS